jgi:hypothetical protein
VTREFSTDDLEQRLIELLAGDYPPHSPHLPFTSVAVVIERAKRRRARRRAAWALSSFALLGVAAGTCLVLDPASAHTSDVAVRMATRPLAVQSAVIRVADGQRFEVSNVATLWFTPPAVCMVFGVGSAADGSQGCQLFTPPAAAGEVGSVPTNASLWMCGDVGLAVSRVDRAADVPATITVGDASGHTATATIVTDHAAGLFVFYFGGLAEADLSSLTATYYGGRGKVVGEFGKPGTGGNTTPGGVGSSCPDPFGLYVAPAAPS